MSTLRFNALEAMQNRQPAKFTQPAGKISEIFGINVFSQETMAKFLPKDALKAVNAAINTGEGIDRKAADLIALGMKEWATTKGATHYTHWFQPLTGLTAEKHDSFFEMHDGQAIESFSGNALVQQEPDASSFPSGGIRNTFEARGYTAWDPSSPAFIMENVSGKTLCIPTIFVSYTGETLDYKAPLLKALHVLDKAAVDVCQLFDKDITKVWATLGVEQEYFLVDSAFLNSRPDLLITGRTLFGHAPAKGQQLEDHYFGSIPERVYAYMTDLEAEAYKLGIPLKTRHNEVAPSQFESAPIFEEINLAVDHNALLMDLMDKVARRHNFKVLLHEKPYAGINGSGKHNNWSIGTNTGKNLLSPGSTPKSNLMFLTFFINTIKAVHEHADLLRASIASAGNDHRLGANEAPPAIISIFLGSQLTDILNEIEATVDDKKKMSVEDKTALKLNIGKIPEILLDNTDRNRTSPFAFTGNKFEFRAVGSAANSSNAMMVLNMIVADQLIRFKKEVDSLMGKDSESEEEMELVAELESAEVSKGSKFKVQSSKPSMGSPEALKKDEAILKVLRQYIVESKNIRFEGNGYSDEWVKEAKRRGLNNIQTTPLALDAFVSIKSMKLYDETGIFNHREAEARHEIMLETYIKKIQIEARLLGDLARNHIVPAALKYQTELSRNVESLKSIGIAADIYKTQVEMISEISNHVAGIIPKVNEMIEARRKANGIENVREKAIAYCDKVRPYFDVIRDHVDKLEMIVDDEMWPLAKYRELVNIR